MALDIVFVRSLTLAALDPFALGRLRLEQTAMAIPGCAVFSIGVLRVAWYLRPAFPPGLSPLPARARA